MKLLYSVHKLGSPAVNTDNKERYMEDPSAITCKIGT